MTSFSETRLELGLTYGASYGPRFSTAINAQANGVEIADAEWEDPLIQINLPDKAYTRSETEYLLDFHATMKGSLTGFRIRDWSDYFVVGQAIGTGNGTVQEWQLIKTYTVGSYSVKRAITKPVAGSLVVYVNGVQTNSGWSVNTTTGKFTTELTGAITVDFEFDVPVRFVEDKLDFRFDAVQGSNALFTQQPITLTEVRVTPWAYPSLDPFPVSLAHQIDLGYDLGTTGGPEFDTFIAETASEWESRVARRDNPLCAWNLGDRTLTRSQVNYLIALFRIARGRAIPFGYMDYQEETVKLIRFTEDRLGVSFLAHRHSDKQAIFSLAAIGAKEVVGDIPQSHVFGTYTSKGGPVSNGQFICNGGCNVTFYWRTIPSIPFFDQSLSQVVVNGNQWYILYNNKYYQVDFIYANNYLANDITYYRGWPQGPFSPHGIGINYVPVGNVCVEDDFSSPAYGDNLVITKVIQV